MFTTVTTLCNVHKTVTNITNYSSEEAQNMLLIHHTIQESESESETKKATVAVAAYYMA